MKSKWPQFIVYALSLVISVALDIWHPDVKDALCTQIGFGGLNNAPINPATGNHPAPTFDKPNL